MLLGDLVEEELGDVVPDQAVEPRRVVQRIGEEAEQPAALVKVPGAVLGVDLLEADVAIDEGEGRGERAGAHPGDDLEARPIASLAPAGEHAGGERTLVAAAGDARGSSPFRAPPALRPTRPRRAPAGSSRGANPRSPACRCRPTCAPARSPVPRRFPASPRAARSGEPSPLPASRLGPMPREAAGPAGCRNGSPRLAATSARISQSSTFFFRGILLARSSAGFRTIGSYSGIIVPHLNRRAVVPRAGAQSTATITSEALMTAIAALPFSRPSSAAASLVIEANSLVPPTSMMTCDVVAPLCTSTMVPAS